MFASRSPQLEQSRFRIVQRLWIMQQLIACFGELILSLSGLNHCAVKKRQGLSQQFMLISHTFQLTRSTAQRCKRRIGAVPNLAQSL